MRSKFFQVVTLLALITILFCCATEPKNNTHSKNITITGFPENRNGDRVFITINTGLGQNQMVAYGIGMISNNGASGSLLDWNNEPWRGSGPYYILIYFESDKEFYLYTDGKSYSELGISDSRENESKIPKYEISKTISNIGFDRFILY